MTMLAGPQLVLMDVSRFGSLSRRVKVLLSWSTCVAATLSLVVIGIQASGDDLSLVAVSSFGVILAAPALIVPEFLASSIQGRGLFARLAVLRVAQVVLPGGLMLAGIPLGGLPGALSGFTLGAAVIGVICHEIWWRQPGVRDANVETVRIPWGYALVTNLTLVLLFLSYRADVFVLNAVSSPHEVGVYSAAVALAELVLVASMSAAVVRAPVYSRDHMAPLGRDAWLVTGLSCAVAGALAVASSIVVPLIFGEEYLGSVEVVWALLPGICVLSAYRFISNAEIVRGHKFGVLLSCIIALVVDVGLLWRIGQEHGALGAAWAASASYVAGCLFLIMFRLVRARRDKSIVTALSETVDV
ncbi:hypothetical protein MOD31_04465 [Paenarthrobacter sp. TYUT067]|uniref:lipopolysaccharide biosynthesis protein n=1 Tax=Paenarthrobacter sp. TYUT067 TaxID=2926245 RepID=UPI00202E8C3A|nr:hypothetical protein [Paenarthrobacter sp. TYUT067]MCM0615266.1 hypothetical protein [Paenarthrobacter sp. TYUT067]